MNFFLLFLVFFSFAKTEALELVSRDTEYVIYYDPVTQSRTFSLNLTWEPASPNKIMRPKREALNYLIFQIKSAEKTYSQIAAEQAIKVEKYYRRLPIARIRRALEYAKNNIKDYKSLYKSYLYYRRNNEREKALECKKRLLQREKDPDLRPNPFIVEVLKKIKHEKKLLV